MALEWSWIFEDIDGRTMDFERWKYAFPLRPTVQLPQLRGKGTQFYLGHLAEVRKEVYQRLRKQNDQDLGQSPLATPFGRVKGLVERSARVIG
ncbi:MAG: hypothetical protein ACFFCW_38610 [Candidatus Hodarchaeota archaeon]